MASAILQLGVYDNRSLDSCGAFRSIGKLRREGGATGFTRMAERAGGDVPTNLRASRSGA